MDKQKTHKAKMRNKLEDSIKVVAPKETYIKINDKKIEDVIKDNVEKMISLNGEIDPANIVNNDIVDLNLLSLYDSNNNIIDYDLEGVRKGATYWEKKTDEYIKSLQDRLNADLSNISKSDFKDIMVEHNKDFFTTFVAGIKANALDLANEKTRLGYANRLANTLTDLQAQEIQNVGIENFLNIDLEVKPYHFIYYIGLDNLKKVQYNALQNKADLSKRYEAIKDTFKRTEEELYFDFIVSDILDSAVDEQLQRVENIYNSDKEFYDKRHKKREEIDILLSNISNKYKEINDSLKKAELKAVNKDSANIIEEMQRQNKNLDKAKFNTSLLSNKLFTGKDIDSNVPYSFSYKEKTKLEDITTSITIYDSKSNSIILSKEHRDINDAVGSLIDSGVRYLTLKQLYNFINKGIINNDPVEEDKIEDLKKALNTMDRKADIDATQQFELQGYQEYLKDYEKKTGTKARPIISQNLINFKMLKNIPTQNGELIDIICFMDYPAVYDYAKQYRQLAPYPVEILNINYSPKNNSKDNTIQINDITRTIRNELIRCIELRKSGYNQPLVINNFLCNECQFYDVIDKDIVDKNNIHTKVLNKQKRIRYTTNIEIILNNFKDKGYIKDYKINKLGKVNKYSITFTF